MTCTENKMYCIGTGTQYIAIDDKKHLYVTADINEARMHSTKQKASNALITLPRKFYDISSRWEVKEYSNQVNKEQYETKAFNSDEISCKTNIDYRELLDNMACLQETKAGCMTYLNGKLSDANEKITDIEHYIEFSNLSASSAYYAYKLLRDTLRERRKIKDCIICAKALYDNCNVERIADCRGKLENRTYAPRQMSELFGEK